MAHKTAANVGALRRDAKANMYANATSDVVDEVRAQRVAEVLAARKAATSNPAVAVRDDEEREHSRSRCLLYTSPSPRD